MPAPAHLDEARSPRRARFGSGVAALAAALAVSASIVVFAPTASAGPGAPDVDLRASDRYVQPRTPVTFRGRVIPKTQGCAVGRTIKLKISHWPKDRLVEVGRTGRRGTFTLSTRVRRTHKFFVVTPAERGCDDLRSVPVNVRVAGSD